MAPVDKLVNVFGVFGVGGLGAQLKSATGEGRIVMTFVVVDVLLHAAGFAAINVTVYVPIVA